MEEAYIDDALLTGVPAQVASEEVEVGIEVRKQAQTRQQIANRNARILLSKMEVWDAETIVERLDKMESDDVVSLMDKISGDDACQPIFDKFDEQELAISLCQVLASKRWLKVQLMSTAPNADAHAESFGYPLLYLYVNSFDFNQWLIWIIAKANNAGFKSFADEYNSYIGNYVAAVESAPDYFSIIDLVAPIAPPAIQGPGDVATTHILREGVSLVGTNPAYLAIEHRVDDLAEDLGMGRGWFVVGFKGDLQIGRHNSSGTFSGIRFGAGAEAKIAGSNATTYTGQGGGGFGIGDKDGDSQFNFSVDNKVVLDEEFKVVENSTSAGFDLRVLALKTGGKHTQTTKGDVVTSQQEYQGGIASGEGHSDNYAYKKTESRDEEGKVVAETSGASIDNGKGVQIDAAVTYDANGEYNGITYNMGVDMSKRDHLGGTSTDESAWMRDANQRETQAKAVARGEPTPKEALEAESQDTAQAQPSTSATPNEEVPGFGSGLIRGVGTTAGPDGEARQYEVISDAHDLANSSGIRANQGKSATGAAAGSGPTPVEVAPSFGVSLPVKKVGAGVPVSGGFEVKIGVGANLADVAVISKAYAGPIHRGMPWTYDINAMYLIPDAYKRKPTIWENLPGPTRRELVMIHNWHGGSAWDSWMQRFPREQDYTDKAAYERALNQVNLEYQRWRTREIAARKR